MRIHAVVLTKILGNDLARTGSTRRDVVIKDAEPEDGNLHTVGQLRFVPGVGLILLSGGITGL